MSASETVLKLYNLFDNLVAVDKQYRQTHSSMVVCVKYHFVGMKLLL